MLGVHAARGRLFAPEENQYGRPIRVVVISDAFWRTHFGGDSAVVGKTMSITDGDGESLYTIIGVAPASFDGLELEVPDMWAPLPDMEGGPETYPVLRVVARVRPGFPTRRSRPSSLRNIAARTSTIPMCATARRSSSLRRSSRADQSCPVCPCL